MKCPNCNVTLVISDRSGVEIDYCPECRGVWLDRGELDKIIDRSLGSTADFDQRLHHSHRTPESEYQYKKKRKDSFLGDLFDF